MTDKTYAEKLKDPRWQKKRLEIFERDYWQCMRCDCETKTLHAHHLLYIKDKEPWDYESNMIVTLCEDCHELAHSDDEDIGMKTFKEIYPVSEVNGFGEEILNFNDFYSAMVKAKGTKIDDSYYKYFRSFFCDSDLNFTTKLNIIKRIGFGLDLNINNKVEIELRRTDELYKYIYLSQDIFNPKQLISNDIEEIIGVTIKYFSIAYSGAYWMSFDELIDCIFNSREIDRITKAEFGIYDTLTTDAILLKRELHRKEKDPMIYLYDQDKWIEAFDCVEWD